MRMENLQLVEYTGADILSFLRTCYDESAIKITLNLPVFVRHGLMTTAAWAIHI